ncbi:MAG: ribonuclease HI family protein [Methanomassiliicoccus sp.]|nr:ribonuclease HI family protein [Methanomassiliicoccus sp.]
MKVKVYTDGGSRGNPGPAAFAVVITSEDGKVVKEYGRYLGKMTNNEAEYSGAIAGLKEARAMGADEVEVISDSEVLVRQVNGVYRCKASNLQPFLKEVQDLAAGFRKATFRNVPREHPMVSRADLLLNQEQDVMISLQPRGKPNP